jgi:hypothetical protein
VDTDAERLKRDTLAARTTEWLTDVGAWVFGGLLALNLVLIAALLDIPESGTAVLIAICAVGCALPLNVGGIVLNRMVKDIRDVEAGEMVTALQAFEEADTSEIAALYPPEEERESLRRKRSGRALLWSLGFAAVSGTLTAVGVVAALWHVAWWIGVAALVTSVVSVVLVTAVVFLSAKPAETEASREFVRRYAEREERRRQEELQGRQQESERGQDRRAA